MAGSWGGVVCDTPSTKRACLSWFALFSREDDDALAAQVFETEDGREPKMRVLVRRPDGTLREYLRSHRQGSFTVTTKVPSAALLKYAREDGALTR